MVNRNNSIIMVSGNWNKDTIDWPCFVVEISGKYKSFYLGSSNTQDFHIRTKNQHHNPSWRLIWFPIVVFETDLELTVGFDHCSSLIFTKAGRCTTNRTLQLMIWRRSVWRTQHRPPPFDCGEDATGSKYTAPHTLLF